MTIDFDAMADRCYDAGFDAATFIVEAWHGDRKVTIYKDVVMRIWGTDIDLDMSHETRTMETVQAAFDWLYGAESNGGRE